MDKFEEFYKGNCLDGYGYNPDLNWIFEKHEDGSYIQIEVENTKKAFKHQQAKVEGLQKRVDAALIEIKGAARWIDEDAIDDPDFIKGGALRALKRLEQALKGEG